MAIEIIADKVSMMNLQTGDWITNYMKALSNPAYVAPTRGVF